MPKPSKTCIRLYKELNNIGLYPILEYSYSDLHMDLAFPEEKIDVEVDGPDHLKEHQSSADHRRDDFLQSHDWKVKRVTASEVHQDPHKEAIYVRNFIYRCRMNNRERQEPLNSSQARESENHWSTESHKSQTDEENDKISTVSIRYLLLLGILVLLAVIFLANNGFHPTKISDKITAPASSITPSEEQPRFSFDFQARNMNEEEIRLEIDRKIAAYDSATPNAITRCMVQYLASSWGLSAEKVNAISDKGCYYTITIPGYQNLYKVMVGFNADCLGCRNHYEYQVSRISN